MILSVIIPTYNPSIDRLIMTINGLNNQSLDKKDWELIIIDNNSTFKFEQHIILPSNAKIIIEPKQGLTFARLKGFETAKGSIIVMVDDDNILDENYLTNCVAIFNQYPNMGAIGGNIEGEFESPPPDWAKDFFGMLAIRNLGSATLIENGNQHAYPNSSPVGAGMGIRKSALHKYLQEINQNVGLISDRSGTNLTSSGDNEIVMQIILSGFDIGFFPQLTMKHLIPSVRLTSAYLGKLNEGIMQSWTSFLLKYKICPWNTFYKYTLQFRIIKAYFKHKPWKNPHQHIIFKGVLGQLKSLAR
ncbi:MAG: glycosyltransferase family 2 protein [Pedobacter sp.]|nr:MAG: glycosyltransferase family 2 protein [Pedobacter sp.]